MSPKLPVVSGQQLIRALERFGYVSVRQRGSHVRLLHPSDPRRQPVTVPLHDTLSKGVLKRILRDAQLTIEDLIGAL